MISFSVILFITSFTWLCTIYTYLYTCIYIHDIYVHIVNPQERRKRRKRKESTMREVKEDEVDDGVPGREGY